MNGGIKLWAARLILPSALLVGVVCAAAAMLRQVPASAPTPSHGRFRVAPAALRRKTAPVSAPSPAPAVVTASAPARAAGPRGYVIRRVLDTGGPIRYGDWFWDEKNVPAGPVIITVDLRANVLSIFRGGYEIGTAAVIYGATDKETPLGVFPIIGKDADHHSTIYGGAPMPYMLRLTNDGISIHGSEVAWDAATHGCIGVPKAFARKLFAATRLGDKVIITRGETLDRGKAITAA